MTIANGFDRYVRELRSGGLRYVGSFDHVRTEVMLAGIGLATARLARQFDYGLAVGIGAWPDDGSYDQQVIVSVPMPEWRDPIEVCLMLSVMEVGVWSTNIDKDGRPVMWSERPDVDANGVADSICEMVCETVGVRDSTR